MPERLDRARTPLLTLISLESMDEDYQVAGRRRSAAVATGEAPAHRPSRRTAVAAVLLVFGLLVAVAAVQTSRESSIDDASRDTLVSRINARRKDVASLEDRIAQQRAANTRSGNNVKALGNHVTAAKSKAAAFGALTGLRAVTGPAVRVALDNAPDADESSRIRDSDIALLVNGLWGAGAEAITVNGQRVTARTGIRTSGDAIEVNGVGVAPPYTILAMGDTDRIPADFLDSSSGQDFVALADQYAFRYDIHDVGRVRVAAAPASLGRLRSADPRTKPHGNPTKGGDR